MDKQTAQLHQVHTPQRGNATHFCSPSESYLTQFLPSFHTPQDTRTLPRLLLELMSAQTSRNRRVNVDTITNKSTDVLE